MLAAPRAYKLRSRPSMQSLVLLMSLSTMVSLQFQSFILHGVTNFECLPAASFVPLPTPDDPLSLPLDSFESSTAVGLGVFAAAQQAITGFRSAVHKDSPKA